MPLTITTAAEMTKTYRPQACGLETFIIIGIPSLWWPLDQTSAPIQVRANERTAAFDALYTEQEAKPLIDTIEPVRITEEPLFSNGNAFCTVNSRPRTSVLNVLSKCSSVISPSVPNS